LRRRPLLASGSYGVPQPRLLIGAGQHQQLSVAARAAKALIILRFASVVGRRVAHRQAHGLAGWTVLK
jgi:hypothetical protein